MIAFLEGVLAAKTADTAYISVNGVGFAVQMTATDLAGLGSQGERVMVYTYMQVREDALSLFGFARQEQKDLFLKLLGVTGVGPKMALAALNTFAPQDFVNAIMAQDVKAVSTIPGVGKKVAQRMILELQGSLATPDPGSLFAQAAAQEADRLAEAREALLSMGFTDAEAQLALNGAPAELTGDSQLLQYALKRLGGR